MTAATGEPIRAPLGRGAVRLPRGYYVGAAIAPFVLLLLWGAFLLLRPTGPTVVRVGDAAPAFALADLDGNPVSLAELQGRPVIVNFWASWCGPCLDEVPMLRDAASAHARDGLAIVGIVFRDRSEAARAFLARMGAAWPGVMDPGEAVAARYGIIWPPDSFFINRDGVVTARQIGQLSAADLERGLAGILGEE
jgi:cytochrome c biogenesis protein CcmG/thiol:disulfide interchange protein DsbE